MRKLLLLCAFAVFGFGPAFAGNASSEDDNNLFNHLAAAVSLGSDGIGIDVAAPIGDMFAVRAGMSIWPRIAFKTDVDPGSNSKSFILNDNGKIDVDVKPHITDFKLLFDYYPIEKSSFHVTAGAFIGSSILATVSNSKQFLQQYEWGKAGIQHGEYKIVSDKSGNICLDVKGNSFKPYLGVGFGRALPRNRIGVTFDLGVQFWGKPAFYTNVKDDFGDTSYRKLTNQPNGNKDLNDYIDKISKIVVCPVLSVRLCGRIF